MRILIAEDDLVSRNFLCKFLSKYGECDLAVDGLETLDAFLLALKDQDAYQLICLDIMMPKVDGVKTLKAIRDLEKQYGITAQNRVKIIMTTALTDPQLVRTAFTYGCEAFAAKPIDTQKFITVMQKLGLIEHVQQPVSPDILAQSAAQEEISPGEGYFKSVRALPGYQLEVAMETGTTIHFDFRPRLNTARFGKLRDQALFNSVQTNGDYLLFQTPGSMPVKITASEFMDLVLIDRRK